MFRSIVIVLPCCTRTRCVRNDSSRRAGNGFKNSHSSMNASFRLALLRSHTSRRNASYASWLPKSWLPRKSNACFTARLKR